MTQRLGPMTPLVRQTALDRHRSRSSPKLLVMTSQSMDQYQTMTRLLILNTNMQEHSVPHPERRGVPRLASGLFLRLS